MTHLYGFGVLKGLRTNHSIAGTPIIAVTHLEKLEHGERFLATGFDGYLNKPVQLHELRQAILKHLPHSGMR
jgi:DNA-binding response OmpR family regulator